MSMPLWLWTYLVRHQAYEAIAIIRSLDLRSTTQRFPLATATELYRPRAVKSVPEIESALQGHVAAPIPLAPQKETPSSTGSVSKPHPLSLRKDTWSSNSSASSPRMWKGKEKVISEAESSTATAAATAPTTIAASTSVLSQQRQSWTARPRPHSPPPTIGPRTEGMPLPNSWGVVGTKPDPFSDSSPSSKDQYLKSVRKLRGPDRKRLREIVSQNPLIGLFSSPTGHHQLHYVPRITV
ncbi:hypothetical protein V8F06_003307 [Rhypophila decipiens]